MKCILCEGILKEYSKSSCLGLNVGFCEKCRLYINGNSREEVVEKVADLYKNEYWNELNSETSINSEYTDVDSQGKRRNWISQYAYIKQYINGKSLLEIGVGAGQSIVWFENEGFDVTGIEPDARNVSMINNLLKKGEVVESSVEEFSSERKFDIIWMSHVLEHLIQPKIFLEKVKKNLNQDGVFFLEVPNCEYEPMLKSSIEKNPHLFHFSKNP